MQALSKQGIVYASHAFAGQGILVMLAFYCMGRLFFFLQFLHCPKESCTLHCALLRTGVCVNDQKKQ